ncbi:hypothetical protein [Natronorubrum thiooxidans]|uniref:HIT zinc finger n=1 Tax=Natronorubrum thiooxidans TaxID=308853 RepID=A0A1N7DXJ8_9EURY|nr:hypothetical protein [Natronorubrum thiooxidans]SIR80563.1 HIT zinc finger [Natronorubrum thiooxidans]
MSVSGLCQICELQPAEEQCPNCGALVCSTHYNEDRGLCADCVAQADPGRQSDDVDINRL